MPMKLEGSCHCKAVTFEVDSNTPYPYQLCQCSICRKVGGFMGSVNIMGLTDSLKIKTGQDKIKIYNAVLSHSPRKVSSSKRHFCSECSSMLWLHDDEYKDFIYPFASAIDTPLPTIPGYQALSADGVSRGGSDEPEKPQMVSIMRDSAPDHVSVPAGCVYFEKYAPGKGIEAWHKKHKLWIE